MVKLRLFFTKKRFRKFCVIAGLIGIGICLYILSFIYGKPTIDTDYLAQLNQINKPENYNPEDNAWPHYQKAFELFKDIAYGNDYHIIYGENDKESSDFNDTEKKIVSGWIEQNQPAW